jgi:predicted flap endonuclease-1-like 5' DNA nuclease
MLIAAVAFVLALFVAMSYLVEGRPLLEWWLPLVLFIIGIAALVLERGQSDASDESALAGPVRTYTVREYTFADQPAAATGPEQAGEVNVREPLHETELEQVVEPATLMPEPVSTPPAPTVDEPTSITAPEPPESENPVATSKDDVLTEQKTYTERAQDDVATGGAFAPPSSAEGFINPATESDSVEGAVVQQRTPVQQKDPARPDMPLEPLEVEQPEQTQAERLEEKGELLQPADTAENEFQSGEHVAANQPTQMPPPGTTTTGEGAGEGHEPMEPVQQQVLDATAAPPQPEDIQGVDPTHPEVAEAVLAGEESEAVDEGLAPSEAISPEPASGSGPDDLTRLNGIGARMQDALRAAGLDNFTKLAAASDDELRSAIEAAGMRLAPTLATWREQASFLAKGDEAGFQALVNAMRSEGHDPDAGD